MKIALLGYGKMGKTIENLAIEAGHKIVYKSGTTSEIGKLEDAEVAIEFSTPEAAVSNILKCFELQIPVVCGTTGWLENYSSVINSCKECNGSFIYASNFSVGVNLFFSINEKLAKLMAPWKEYSVSIEEIHHTEKKDAPSGTAITIADSIIAQSDNLERWSLESKKDHSLRISAKRIADVKGTHTVTYESDVDEISITHKAKSRIGFAKGAILAAVFLKDKKGLFTMQDVLDL
ncbi:4-hydroxy-tetrahydrodipicolinate reductase [Patiriisocius marinus]|uniref:4-hydroxy-tetrahydrodipicolinate reductase n=1 Tax=Patiriisocius marinus TaxID=1397112 RepID=A0A5J4IZE7_9FLAO|nr:4-hydroxy-tetrahydrodipicolinate reductase [Patiriisocius marinus]GER59008.1 4-hydroxy-tetrahydrodipicolinate reductase [Patiriisocius marinus]